MILSENGQLFQTGKDNIYRQIIIDKQLYKDLQELCTTLVIFCARHYMEPTAIKFIIIWNKIE